MTSCDDCPCGRKGAVCAANPEGHYVDCPAAPDAEHYRAKIQALLDSPDATRRDSSIAVWSAGWSAGFESGRRRERDRIREALIAALAAPVPARPGVPVARIWGRDRDDPKAGPEANLWAGTPADVADLIVSHLQEDGAA